MGDFVETFRIEAQIEALRFQEQDARDALDLPRTNASLRLALMAVIERTVKEQAHLSAKLLETLQTGNPLGWEDLVCPTTLSNFPDRSGAECSVMLQCRTRRSLRDSE